MSSRQLRKLQQQRELEKQAKLQKEQQEESEDEPIPQKPKANIFSFAALEDAEEDEDQDEEKEVAEPEEVSDHEPVQASASKKSKKSKKKKKGKGKNKEKQPEPEDHAIGADEIEEALRELNLKPKPKGASEKPTIPVNPEYNRVCELLGINSQHLKVANEMRTLFGKAAIENHDDAGGPVPRGSRRRQQQAREQQMDLETALKGRHAPGKGLSEVTMRRNCFIQGKDEWPKATTGGLTVAVVDDSAPDGTVEFRFVHDSTYQAVQGAFHTYVEMGDPQQLIALLTQHPYHISLLIQVSKIAKDQTDHALSSDLLERALFTFGRAATSLFSAKLQAGKARLDFTRPENREFWLAGYHYIKSLIMKGTYRTALEWAKCLLSLDPEEDPYCMRFMIHHLAIRAHQNERLLSLSDSIIDDIWNSGNIVMYAGLHLTPSNAYAALLLKQSKKCRELLTNSMHTVPWLFTRLFRELNLDAPPSIWGIEPRTDAENLFSELYVLQTKDLWGTPEATSLLMEIAHTIPKGSINLSSCHKTQNEEMTLNVVRFVYLENNPITMGMVPGHLLHKSNNSDGDPIPPDVNTFSYPIQQRVLRDRDAGFEDAFNDPLAALAQLIPGLRRGGAEEDDVRRALGEALEAEVQDRNGDGDGEPPQGLARRLLNMLWGGMGGIHDGGGETESEDEWVDEEGTDTDTDGMPGLVEEDEFVGDDDDGGEDEMPDLIDLE